MHFGSINPIKRKSQQQSNFQPVNWNTNILHTPQKSFIPRGPTPIKLARGSPSPLKRTPKRQSICRPIILHYEAEYTQTYQLQMQKLKQTTSQITISLHKQ